MSAIYAYPGNEAFADLLAAHGDHQRLALDIHHFPDGESLARIALPPTEGEAVFVCTLEQPDSKLMPLLMAAAAARELGAAKVGLVAPYLAYMRQDKRFYPGEAISSRTFAKLLSSEFDWMITVDPHLHRCHALAEIYTCDAHVVSAAPRIAEWIGRHVTDPLIVGPDGESEQWARSVADAIGAPCVIATKQRRGDRDVSVAVPDVDRWPSHTPVLLDDIISSGRTMVETIIHLRSVGMKAPVCIGVHGVFAPGALAALHDAGAVQVVTTNAITGATSEIDLSADIAAAMVRLSA